MNGLLQAFDRIWRVYYLSVTHIGNPAFCRRDNHLLTTGKIGGKVIKQFPLPSYPMAIYSV